MVKNQSLRGVGAAEPIWWNIRALEGWVHRSQYCGKSKPPRGGCTGANIGENQNIRGVGAAEPVWWKIKALEGWAQRSKYGGKSKP